MSPRYCYNTDMKHIFSTLTPQEKKVFNALNTPQKIQDFLETIPVNFEQSGNTLRSPRNVLKQNTAQCFEGALLAAAILWYHGHKPLLLDLVTTHNDDSHVVVLYTVQGKWGALSKTNHAVLRFRDAVYASPQELAMSYFHEYFLDNGEKTLRSYAVFDLQSISEPWVIDEHDVWYIDQALDRIRHTDIMKPLQIKKLRLADPIEREAGKIVKEKKAV